MRPHLEKTAIRAMGVAECFRPTSQKSILCAVVMRSDLVVDGCIFGTSTIEGEDATENIISMFRKLRRNDINLIMTLGSVISIYNIIDTDKITMETDTPTISITFEKSDGLEEHIRNRFPENWKSKVKQYEKLSDRNEVKLATGHVVFLRQSGFSLRDAKQAVDKFTLQGSIPEPLRLARIIARAKVFGKEYDADLFESLG